MSLYLTETRKPSYNLLFAGILLVLYEGLIFLTQPSHGPRVVNLVDSWADQLLALIPYGHWIVLGVFLAATAYFVYQDRREGNPPKATTLLYMWLESWAWALFLFFNLSLLMSWLPIAPNSLQLPHQAGLQALPQQGFWGSVALSLGAGFYEEFLFRFVLVWAFIGLFRVYPMGMGKWSKHIVIILLTAVLFSLAHHIPPYGEPLEFYRLLYRTLFGVFMSVILIFRGFGIAAWAHALYDVCIDFKTHL